MSSFGKSSAYTFLAQIPTQLFGIIAGIFITRILGPEGRGLYAIFHADIALFSTLLGFSISTAIIQFRASEKFSEGRILGMSFLFTVISIVLSVIVLFLWLLTPYSDLLLPNELLYFNLIGIFVVFLALTQITTVYSALLQGARRFDLVNRILLLNSVFNLASYGLLYYFYWIGYAINLEHILINGVIILSINWLQWHLAYKKIRMEAIIWSNNWQEQIKPFLKFSGIGHLSNVINFFNYRLVLWIIAVYLDNYQLGLFALASGLTQLLGFISNPLSQVLMPFLSSSSEVERKQLFIRFSRLHFLLLILLCAIAVVVAPLFIPLLYGQEFEASIFPFWILLIGAILSGQTKIFASLLIANDQIKYNLYATIVGFLLTFTSNFILVRWYGIEGAAWAQSITYTGIFLAVYIAIIKFTKVKTVNLFIPNKSELNYAWKRLRRKS